ncbi:MAG: AAA domain-containing protein, partial [Turicibacter sp.]|nr:AAA domain-containing protein [Turicibacter sp.]
MSKVKDLFEYLLGLRHLTYDPVRKIQDYDKHWMMDAFSGLPGITIGPGESFIEVRQQQFKGDYPTFSPVLGRALSLSQFDYTKEKSRLMEPSELKAILQKELAELKIMASLDGGVTARLSPWKQLLTGKLMNQATLTEIFGCLAAAETLAGELLESYKEWSPRWEAWAKVEQSKRAAQKFYEYLFHLRQNLSTGERPLEIVIGTGMLYGQFKESVQHPLLTTRLELDFDGEAGVARLKPAGHGLKLELEMLVDVAIPNHVELMEVKKEVEAGGISPFDQAGVSRILKSFIHYLHPDGVFSDSLKAPIGVKKPVVTMEQSLFIREVSTVRLTVDLKNTIDYLNDGGKVPDTVKAMVGETIIERKNTWDEALLFPMPANESQKKIGQLIGQYDAVTVQGPPGTGKSHTIANLVAHLVAHGHRVLVTSEKDKALTVLMNKLPEEVRDLTVSVFGNQDTSLNQMIHSVEAICHGLSAFDEKTLTQDIQILNRSLDMVKRQIHLAEQNLIRFRELDAKGVLWQDRMTQPYELAQLAAQEIERFDFVEDSVEMDANQPMDNESFARLWHLRGRLSPEDLAVQDYRFPSVKIMGTSEFLRLLVEKNQYEEKLAALDFESPFEIPQQREGILALDKEVQTVVKLTLALEEKIERTVLEDCLLDEERLAIWKAVYTQLQGIIVAINAHELNSMNYEVDCPFYGLSSYEESMRTLRLRLESGKKLGGMYLLFNGEVKAFYENTRVNGQRIHSIQDLQQIKWHQEKNDLLQEFSKIWNRHFGPLGAEMLDPHHGQVLFNYHSRLRQLGKILDVSTQFESLRGRVNGSIPLELGTLPLLKDAMTQAKSRQKLDGFKEIYQTLLRQYKGPLLAPGMHPICKELYDCLVAGDEELFPEIRQQLDDLMTAYSEVSQYSQLLEALKPEFPHLAGKIGQWVGRDMPLKWTFSDIHTYAKLKTFLEKIESWNPDDLELKVKLMEEEQNKLVRKLIKKMAWKHQLSRLDQTSERALLSWLQKAQRFEKTSAKAMQAMERQSKMELQACHDAIPVWVMPVKDVLETFPPNPDLFDVIIVDEASQCNVTSLPILMRANKAVIVGDDQQISPVLPGISDAQVSELAARYLHEFAKPKEFDLQTSLYDVAARSYTSKGKLMLKEHFRCVPEIIGFSNMLSYQNQMVPLKLPLPSEKFSNPVEAIYVDGALRDNKKTNEAEAAKMVGDIALMVKDPKFDGKTIGVISLLGIDQAKLIQKMLLEAIGEAEMISRDLICGDAYSFQGDERDIMMLSLVVAPNARYATLNKKMYTQRFNVAASRAKSLMRLYHSVTLDELNPEDVRHTLLSYCQNPLPATALKSGDVETILEKDVYEAIRQAGYDIKPKVQVGGHHLDLVIEGNRSRLAIECTGDSFYGGEQIEQDMDRQR